MMKRKFICFAFILMLIMGGQVLATSTTTRQQLTKPSITGTYVYNGQIQTANLINFDDSLMNVAGITNVNAGTHTVTVSLKNPNSYEWSDGTIDPVTLEWIIERQSVSMEVEMEDYYYGSKKSVPSVVGDNNTGNVIYYYSTTDSNTGGTLWTDVQDSTGLEPGTYYMYAVVGETTNYYAATTQPVQFNITRISINAELQSKGNAYNGEWTNNKVEARVTLPTTINELTYVYYKKNGDTMYVPHENTEMTGNVVTITFDEPMNEYISLVGVNVAGRAITESIGVEIKIEKNAPKVTSINKKVDEDIVKVIANVEDEESGIRHYAITSGETLSSWIELDEDITEGQISLEIPANEIWYLWLRDAAGNVIEEEKEIVVYRDVTPPDGSIEIVGNEVEGVVYVNDRNVTLKITADDDTTRPEDLRMKIFEEEEFLQLTSTDTIAWDAFAKEVQWPLSDGDGTKKVYLILRDAYGNVSVSFAGATVRKAEYTVHYYLENVDDENYSEYDVATKIGNVDSQIQLINLRKKITGATYAKTTTSENGPAVTEATIAADGSTEVYLYYDRNEYTLALEKNEYVNNVTGAGKYKYGKTVEISAELEYEEGYTHNFIEWSSSNKALVTDKTSLNDTLSMPASDIALTAKANKTANEYTVTFNANGGIIRGAGTETITQKVIYGEAYGNIIPTVEQRNSVFAGWKTADGTVINSESIVNIAEDHTLYAEWQSGYILTINPNGALWEDTLTSEIREYIGASGETINLPNVLPKEDGIKIVLDGNGGTIDGFETYTVLKDVIIAYMYLPYDQKGTYDEVTGEYTFANSDASMKVVNYAQITANDFSTPIRDGYICTSWNTERDGTGTSVQIGNYFYAEETILYAQWEISMFKVTLDANGGVITETGAAQTTRTVTYGSAYGELPKATRDGYIFLGWFTEATDGTQITSGDIVTTEADGQILYAHWEVAMDLIPSIANEPVLGDGMQAVYWSDENASQELTATAYTDEMYNYTIGDGKTDTKENMWANAVTEDGSYWVWIPRYAYKITYTNEGKSEKSGQTTSTAEISGTKTEYGNIDILFMYGTSNTQYRDENGNAVDLPEGYKVHPAFQAMEPGTETTSGEAELGNPLGKWDEELEGIWVAKYEASMETLSNGTWENTNILSTSIGDVLTTSTRRVVSKPSVINWRYISESNIYQNSLNMYADLNSHQMKNSEWGAVAYLTQSAYGRNGNEIAVNQCIHYTGAGPGEGNSTVYNGIYAHAEDTFANSYAWNTTQGKKASSTGNIYGIYDLSGGAYEYVAAYIAGGDSSYVIGADYGGALGTATDMKTKQVYAGSSSDGATNYAENTEIYGDAVYETSIEGTRSTSWNSDDSYFPNSSRPLFDRGGSDDDRSSAGVFNFHYNNGYYYDNCGFRPVLCVSSDT